MRNAKKCWVLARCTYLCTKFSSKSVFGYVGWGCLKCGVLARRSRLERRARTPYFLALRISNKPNPRYPKTLLLAYLAQRYARLGRRAKPPYFLASCISNTPSQVSKIVLLACLVQKYARFAYFYTKHTSKNVFGYLRWGCLKCPMPKNVGFWRGPPSAHTSAPNMRAEAFLDT